MLIQIQAHPEDYRFKDEPSPDWTLLLSPQSFHDVFPNLSPDTLMNRVHAYNNKNPNYWAYCIRYLLACRKTMGLFLDGIETVFWCMGYTHGLKEFINRYTLNTCLDFTHSFILQTFEAHYLIAAYNFFLAEDHTLVAHYILNILHAFFPRSDYLTSVIQNICIVIDPPNESLSLLESDTDSEFESDEDIEMYDME